MIEINNESEFWGLVENRSREYQEDRTSRTQKTFDHYFNFHIERLKFASSINGYYLTVVSILLVVTPIRDLVVTDGYLFGAVSVSIFGFITSLILIRNQYDFAADYFLRHVDRLSKDQERLLQIVEGLKKYVGEVRSADTDWNNVFVEQYLKKILGDSESKPEPDKGVDYLGEYVVGLTSTVVLLSVASFFDVTPVTTALLIGAIFVTLYFTFRSDRLESMINNIGKFLMG